MPQGHERGAIGHEKLHGATRGDGLPDERRRSSKEWRYRACRSKAAPFLQAVQYRSISFPPELEIQVRFVLNGTNMVEP